MSDTAKKKNIDPRTVVLKGVRYSFTDSIVEKKATVEDGVPKYGMNVVIEKTGPYAKYHDENQRKVIAAIEAAGMQEWGDTKGKDAWKIISEDQPKRVCFRKGERFKNQTTNEPYEGYAGNLAITMSGPGGGKNRPKIRDRMKRPVVEADIADVCYSGTYGDAVISFFGTEKGGRGIFASIEGLRSYQEGARISSGVQITDDMFEDMDEDSPFDDADEAPTKDFDPLA